VFHVLIHFFSFFRDIHLEESSRALFKCLGPTLVSVVPARAINFFRYGTNGKRLTADKINDGRENSWVHLSAAAALAEIVTETATNPTWIVKTRLQLVQGDKKALGGIWNLLHQEDHGFEVFIKTLPRRDRGYNSIGLYVVIYEPFKKLNIAAKDGTGFLNGSE
jgi:solute carrier family 25, member 33/36